MNSIMIAIYEVAFCVSLALLLFAIFQPVKWLTTLMEIGLGFLFVL